MSKVSIYLNFQGNAMEAFQYYKMVFQSDFIGQIMYMKDVPMPEGAPPMSEKDANCIMHICLPIMGGIQLMATDMLESQGHKLIIGNNTTIHLEPDSKEEADRLFHHLSINATDCAPMSDQFWGYWGCCLDQFGIRWMITYFDETQNA